MVATIQYIEKIIATFAEAADANLATSARQGNVVVLTPECADDVMVTGDLHGHRGNFNALKKIADLDDHPRRHLILQEVCHGGPAYPANGGCMSHTLLEDVAKLKTLYPQQVHFILGNHELAELTDYPIQKNKQMLNLLFRLGLQQAYGAATEKIREAYSSFLLTCPLGARLPNGVLITHSVPENVDARPFDPTLLTRRLDSSEFYERTAIFDLVWGRDYREENARAFAEQMGAKVLLNGHEPCPEGFSTPNSLQVILDCCAEKACYVILPVEEELTQQKIVDRIERLV